MVIQNVVQAEEPTAGIGDDGNKACAPILNPFLHMISQSEGCAIPNSLKHVKLKSSI